MSSADIVPCFLVGMGFGVILGLLLYMNDIVTGAFDPLILGVMFGMIGSLIWLLNNIFFSKEASHNYPNGSTK